MRIDILGNINNVPLKHLSCTFVWLKAPPHDVDHDGFVHVAPALLQNILISPLHPADFCPVQVPREYLFLYKCKYIFLKVKVT